MAVPLRRYRADLFVGECRKSILSVRLRTKVGERIKSGNILPLLALNSFPLCNETSFLDSGGLRV